MYSTLLGKLLNFFFTTQVARLNFLMYNVKVTCLSRRHAKHKCGKDAVAYAPSNQGPAAMWLLRISVSFALGVIGERWDEAVA